MTVWSGLLLRVKNEAELGAVLGHEFGHFELRHSLNGFKQKRSTTDIIAWASILVPAPGAALSLGLVGNFYAFNRGQEKEADFQGLNYLASSSFPSAAAANVWERLMGEQDATALGRKRKITRSYSAGFAASHPTDLARATYLRAEAVKIGDEGDTRFAEYRTGIAKWLPDFLDDQIKRNDFGGSEYLFTQLASDGWNPDLLYARAELYRQRGNPRDLVTASQLYEEAIAKGLKRPEAKRGLGLALMRSQQVDSGKAALKQYLDEVPGASDALMISALIAN